MKVYVASSEDNPYRVQLVTELCIAGHIVYDGSMALYNIDAIHESDVCIMTMPAGTRCNFEAGYFAGTGKPLIILSPGGDTHPVLYKVAWKVCQTPPEITGWLRFYYRLRGILTVLLQGQPPLGEHVSQLDRIIGAGREFWENEEGLQDFLQGILKG